MYEFKTAKILLTPHSLNGACMSAIFVWQESRRHVLVKGSQPADVHIDLQKSTC